MSQAINFVLVDFAACKSDASSLISIFLYSIWNQSSNSAFSLSIQGAS